MDPTLVPAMPGIPPGVPLDFGAAFLPLLVLLKIAGVAAVLLVAVAVVVGPPIQELLGMATMGTVGRADHGARPRCVRRARDAPLADRRCPPRARRP